MRIGRVWSDHRPGCAARAPPAETPSPTPRTFGSETGLQTRLAPCRMSGSAVPTRSSRPPLPRVTMAYGLFIDSSRRPPGLRASAIAASTPGRSLQSSRHHVRRRQVKGASVGRQPLGQIRLDEFDLVRILPPRRSARDAEAAARFNGHDIGPVARKESRNATFPTAGVQHAFPGTSPAISRRRRARCWKESL